MSIFDFKFWRPKGDPAANQIVRRGNHYRGFGGAVLGDAPVIEPEQALEISAVYAAVKMLSQDIGRMPINLVRRVYDTKGREVRSVQHNHPMHKLVSIKPNAWQTPFEFITTMMTQALLTGEALALKVKDGTGTVTAIVPLPAGSWAVDQLGTGRLIYTINLEGGVQTRTQDEVIAVRSAVSLSGLQSFNPTILARQAFGIASGLGKIQLNLIANNGRPGGIVNVKNAFGNEEEEEKFVEKWNERYGATGRGGIALLESDEMSYYPIQMSLVDSQFIESRKFAVEEIARKFGIPFEKIIPSTKSYASAVQTARSYVTDALMPNVVMLEQALRRDLLNSNPELIFDFDEKELLRGSNQETAEYLMKLIGSPGQQGVISVNEARYELGLPLMDGEEFEVPKINNGKGVTEIEELKEPS